MKKSLLALAILGGFAGVASAQSSVTLSGSLDAGIRHKGTATGYDWSMGGSQSGYNAFTLSGIEDLGGGLRAFFALNHRFKIQNGQDNGTTNGGGTDPFWRNTAVGLGGGFGDVRLGRILMPLQDIDAAFDPFNTGTVGSVHTGGINATLRANNAIYYRSPNFGGVSVAAAIAAGEGQVIDEIGSSVQNFNGSTALLNSQRPVGINVKYAAGPVAVGAAYDRNTADMKTAGAYGSWDFGVVKIMGQFEKGQNYTANTLAGKTNETVKALSVGAIVPVGAFRILAGYQRLTSNLTNANANKLGLGAEYSLSKRTLLYTDLGKWNGNRISVANKKTQFDIGVRHAF